MGPTKILDRLSEDPNGYNDRDNRIQAHLIIGMRRVGIDDAIIYQTLNLLVDATEASKR